MGFNVGDFIEGAVMGFLETGSPIGAVVEGTMDGLTNRSPLQQMGVDNLFASTNSTSSIMQYAQLAEAFAEA